MVPGDAPMAAQRGQSGEPDLLGQGVVAQFITDAGDHRGDFGAREGLARKDGERRLVSLFCLCLLLLAFVLYEGLEAAHSVGSLGTQVLLAQDANSAVDDRKGAAGIGFGLRIASRRFPQRFPDLRADVRQGFVRE